MTTFEDHFSEQAREYAQYRPQYPRELFDYLASIASGRQLAWDCGTGNGQAARELTSRFERVVATDASPEQIAQAPAHERLEYRVARAEEVDLEAGSVDLVTVAMAVHWFDLEPFYQAVRQVVKPNGVLAIWMYHLPVIDPAVDLILTHYYENVLAGYWPERFHYLDEHYRSLPFPFDELKPPEFEIQVEWELDRLAGFLDSWSGTRRYKNEHGRHPLNLIWQGLSEAWGEPDKRRSVRWPLSLRVGQVE